MYSSIEANSDTNILRELFRFWCNIAYDEKSSKSKKKIADEWVALIRFLLANSEFSLYPELLNIDYRIEKTESPDFHIRFPERIYTFEVTECTTPILAAARDKRQRNNSEEIIEYVPCIFSSKPPKKNEADRCLKKAGDSFNGSAFYGDFPEIKWAKRCFDIIKKKNSQYKERPIDFLLIFDTLHLTADYGKKACYLKSIEINNPLPNNIMNIWISSCSKYIHYKKNGSLLATSGIFPVGYKEIDPCSYS